MQMSYFIEKIVFIVSVNLAIVGGALASWLACSTPDRVVQVRELAGDIVLCSWARHFTRKNVMHIPTKSPQVRKTR